MLTQLREYKKVESVRGVVGLEGKKRDVRKTICPCCAINPETGLDFTYCAFSLGNHTFVSGFQHGFFQLLDSSTCVEAELQII